MKWFRFYSDALDDPKVQRLPAELFKHWINLLCLANDGEPRGELPCVDDIAFRLRVDDDTAIQILRDLTERGLIDDDSETLQPHNWDERQRQSDNVTERVRRHRAKIDSPVARNEDVTLHETDSERSCNASRAQEAEVEVEVEAEGDTDSDTEAEEVTLRGRAPAPARRRSKHVYTVTEEIAATAETLAAAAWVNDDPAAVEQAVARSFALVDAFVPSSGPVEAESFVRYQKKPPDDWYRGWLNWLKHAVKFANERPRGSPNGRQPTVREPDFSGIDEWGAAMKRVHHD